MSINIHYITLKFILILYSNYFLTILILFQVSSALLKPRVGLPERRVLPRVLDDGHHSHPHNDIPVVFGRSLNVFLIGNEKSCFLYLCNALHCKLAKLLFSAKAFPTKRMLVFMWLKQF